LGVALPPIKGAEKCQRKGKAGERMVARMNTMAKSGRTDKKWWKKAKQGGENVT